MAAKVIDIRPFDLSDRADRNALADMITDLAANDDFFSRLTAKVLASDLPVYWQVVDDSVVGRDAILFCREGQSCVVSPRVASDGGWKFDRTAGDDGGWYIGAEWGPWKGHAWYNLETQEVEDPDCWSWGGGWADHGLEIDEVEEGHLRCWVGEAIMILARATPKPGRQPEAGPVVADE